eukprot:TRINITY_DN12681_c2_g1_i2.p2 TRINITY_DN12681_c2_g1~~TRINITY_DN12681_c2_g1_i2.p2  ORF type:complete len:240 (+),score=33.46 TRINITY_DN12681_c2_g1_i2:80-799(+)
MDKVVMAFEKLDEVKSLVKSIHGLVEQHKEQSGHVHVASWFQPGVCASELPVHDILETNFVVGDDVHDQLTRDNVTKLLLDRTATLGQCSIEAAQRLLELHECSSLTKQLPVGQLSYDGVITQWAKTTQHLVATSVQQQQQLHNLEARLEQMLDTNESQNQEVETYRHILANVNPDNGKDQRCSLPEENLRAQQQAKWDQIFKDVSHGKHAAACTSQLYSSRSSNAVKTGNQVRPAARL